MRHILARSFLALTAAALVWGPLAPTARAASVAEQATLQPVPRPPFVTTQWQVNVVSGDTPVTTRAWIYKWDCRTGAFLGTVSFRTSSTTRVGTNLVSSAPYQVLAGDCLQPAGNATTAKGQVVSTQGPVYRWG